MAGGGQGVRGWEGGSEGREKEAKIAILVVIYFLNGPKMYLLTIITNAMLNLGPKHSICLSILITQYYHVNMTFHF